MAVAKGGEQAGIALDLFAQAGVEHLYHIHHAGRLVMQVFNRKIFKLLAGVVAQQKSEQQKSVATLAPVSSDSFVPRPARRKKVIINCSLLKSDGCSTAEQR